MMKKLLLSVVLAFAAQTAMANVLELQVTPLNPVEGSKTKHLKLYTSGEVHLNYCDIKSGVCDPSTHLATLSWYAMNHLQNMVEQARHGVMVEEIPTCTAVPTEAKSYTADSRMVVLEDGTYPCGAQMLNRTDAAYYLSSVLKQYE